MVDVEKGADKAMNRRMWLIIVLIEIQVDFTIEEGTSEVEEEVVDQAEGGEVSAAEFRRVVGDLFEDVRQDFGG